MIRWRQQALSYKKRAFDMATKNLARTVIEGGRAPRNKDSRYRSNAVERRHAHQLELALCRRDPLDDHHFVPRQPVRQRFDDKLGPALRYLRSQVGRPWDKVRSDLFARFDTRTTAGRHILFDHLLADVSLESSSDKFARFVVSRHGILRYRGRQRYSYGTYRQRLPEPEAALREWLGGRRVLAHGALLYWLVPTAFGGYRQQHGLTTEEAARFRALPDWFRHELEGAPPAPSPGI